MRLRSRGQLSDGLSLTPLALLFVTVLLEQKRRRVLHSASAALADLWSHLLVPLVPFSLAGDLIQYPAPFILGVTSEEAKSA
jgi:hypothetical protein